MTLRCTDLRCERLVGPIGIGTATPRLTWRLEGEDGEADVVQQAHQLELDGLWDTGRIESWRQQVTYDGPPIGSGRPARWRVRAWTTAGVTDWSEWATFESGILDPDLWVATMITATASTPVVRFARTVDVPHDVRQARLRLSAHGIVTATIAGVEVGDDVLTPGWTSYHHRLVVRTYDVTSTIGAGDVEIAVLVAPGWFRGRLGWEGKHDFYGHHLGALAQLELERSDGSLVVVGTDESWTAGATPFLLADLYDGETYDARRAVACDVRPVFVVDGFDHRVLTTPAVPPVRRAGLVPPVSRAGNILDFGQNLVGWLRITVHGVPAGTEVALRHAEVLDADGQLFTAPLRTAKATDTYITGGADEEVYEPRFTFAMPRSRASPPSRSTRSQW